MPSGAKRRKAAKKKKQAGEARAQNQQHDNKEDSGNEQELENDHEQEQDHVHEEDPITPKTPVQNNEGEEKEKNGVAGGTSDTEDVGFLDRGFNQNQDNHTETSFQKVESTDDSLVIPENGGGAFENEVEVSSGGVLENKDGPIRDLDSSSSSSSSSSNHVDGDEIHYEEKDTRTDVGVIELGLHNGDESEVSSSKLVVSEENESNRTLVPSANANQTLPKDDDDTQVEMEAHSEELESSDGDESKLDVVSTMATLDANESIQSVGSVDSPRSVHSQQYMDLISNERAELASQDQERGSEGFSEIPFQELGSKADFLSAESDDKPEYKVGMEFLQEENCHQNSLSKESSKGLGNEDLLSAESGDKPEYEVGMELLQEENGHQNSLSEESSKVLENEENVQVSTEVVCDNYATVTEELIQVVADQEKTQVACSFSLADANEESEAIPKVDDNDAKESVMLLSKSESVNTRPISVVSTSGAGEEVVSVGEASQDVVSAIGEGKDGMGAINVQETSAEPNETSPKEITSHPQNGTNEKKIILPQRESKTSWLNCCGIMDLFTSARS